MKNEQNSLKQILKIRSENYQNEIEELRQKNVQMDVGYLKMITGLEKKLNQETSKFKRQIQQNKNWYERKFEKEHSSFEEQLDILNSINRNLKKEIDDLKEEKKEAVKEELENGFNYKKLYQCLVESFKQHFDSPISLDKMKSPFILKSGQTVGEHEFMVLYPQKHKDPFDRTKRVDIKIPNLALSNIMDTIDHFEDIHKKMSKYKV